jgi:hypothetical protein
VPPSHCQLVLLDWVHHLLPDFESLSSPCGELAQRAQVCSKVFFV